jgi:penicillin-binding protein 1A
MKAAHQGVAVAPLPASQPGGLLTTIAQAISSAAPASSPAPGATRPAPARASVRPEAASGLDGWLMERLFGR